MIKKKYLICIISILITICFSNVYAEMLDDYVEETNDTYEEGYDEYDTYEDFDENETYDDGYEEYDEDYTVPTEIQQINLADGQEEAQTAVEDINYLILVNKLNAVPYNWKDNLEFANITNSLGDNVEIESKTYDAYLKLKEALETEDIHIDIKSAYIDENSQRGLYEEAIKKYGDLYAEDYVDAPNFSESQTGLALDLYLTVNGKDITKEKKLLKQKKIWKKIHEQLPEYGFILRYPKGKEHLTGYTYKPWHIRYIDDVEIAKELAENDLTFEEALDVATDINVNIDYNESKTYSKKELKKVVSQLKCKFATYAGCVLEKIKYAGDEFNSKENLDWLNGLSDNNEYTKIMKFLVDFHSPDEETISSFDPDTDYKDYEFWYALDKDGNWKLVSYGY